MEDKAKQEQVALDEDIRSVVAETIASRMILDAVAEAEKMSVAHPTCGMSADQIKKLLIKIAAASKIAVGF